MCFHHVLLLLSLCLIVNGKGFWSSTSASYGDIIRDTFLIGNGKLGGMPFTASPGVEKINLNVDSLWSGGPFQSAEYTGGNPSSGISQDLPGIREWIFQNGTGNISGLLGNGNYYGSFQVLGNLSVAIDGVSSTSKYNRSLDLNTGIHTTSYNANDGRKYISIVYCSYPDQVCIYNFSSTRTLPTITIALENQLVDPTLLNLTCSGNVIELQGLTQLGPPRGMQYGAIARLTGVVETVCRDASLLIPSSSNISTFAIVIGAGTNYDQTKGNPENHFSFIGEVPQPYLQSVTDAAAEKPEPVLRDAHIADYQNLSSTFTLDLPDMAESAGLEISAIIDRYNANGPGDPYLESLLFSYGRHLFISSSRENSLPPNLAGKWSETLKPAWSGDYHANINLQMNHWAADSTGLGDLQTALWNYMENTWVPRGTETAQLLYNAPGWVVHDEMNIFGHTGMKNVAQWADYPAAAAWMMQHVIDHYEFSQNATFWKTQGYPLVKGIAQFWHSQLQEDLYFNDNTLVVNPCNSPEHGPTTFACTHYQQLIFQVFTGIVAYAAIAEETDSNFLSNITSALVSLDKGFHIGTWGEVKEWKIPESFGYDFENDTHRHLSNLVGWYPGYSLSSYLGGYSNRTIQSAVETTLWSRGTGNGSDGHAGWEKVWRSACWARLNETERAYFELRIAIEDNFAGNGLSMYSAGKNPPFQIDANFGLLGAVLSFLVVDLPGPSPTIPTQKNESTTHTVVLGPAIPATWEGGAVKGLRLRYGGTVDFAIGEGGMVIDTSVSVDLLGRERGLVVVDRYGGVLWRS